MADQTTGDPANKKAPLVQVQRSRTLEALHEQGQAAWDDVGTLERPLEHPPPQRLLVIQAPWAQGKGSEKCLNVENICARIAGL